VEHVYELIGYCTTEQAKTLCPEHGKRVVYNDKAWVLSVNTTKRVLRDESITHEVKLDSRFAESHEPASDDCSPVLAQIRFQPT
jgi:hypothetical protein